MEGAGLVAEGLSTLPAWKVTGPGGRLLQSGHVYQWSCRVRTQRGWSAWFAPNWGFSVASAVRPPALKLPADGATVRARPLLVVRPAGLGGGYHFQVWSGRTLVGEGTSPRPFWRYDGDELEPGEVYTWTCRYEALQETTDWAVPFWRFQVAEGSHPVQALLSDAVANSVSATPTAFSSGVEFRAGAGFGPVVSVEVFDVDGRRIRRLGRGQGFWWDGRTERGVPAGPGTYVCLVAGKHGSQMLKVTKVK
jgi:hypothetical protein